MAIAAARGDCRAGHPSAMLSVSDGHFAGPRRGAAGGAARGDGRRQRRRGLVRARRLWVEPHRRGGGGRPARAARAQDSISAIATPASCSPRSTRPGSRWRTGRCCRMCCATAARRRSHRALDWLVRRDPAALEPGLSRAAAMAFNLTVLSNLLGTAIEPDFTGAELLIEEVAEHAVPDRPDDVPCHRQPGGAPRGRDCGSGRMSDIPENDPCSAATRKRSCAIGAPGRESNSAAVPTSAMTPPIGSFRSATSN